tara:strand:+ start:142 stop:582 length:441 start_codon:yes stop_codon:yes gene_type:complete
MNRRYNYSSTDTDHDGIPDYGYVKWNINKLQTKASKPKCIGKEVGNEPGDGGGREADGINYWDCTALYPEQSQHRTRDGAKEWCANHYENPWFGDAKQCKAAATPKSTTGCNLFPHGSFPANPLWAVPVGGDCYYCENDHNAHCDP